MTVNPQTTEYEREHKRKYRARHTEKDKAYAHAYYLAHRDQRNAGRRSSVTYLKSARALQLNVRYRLTLEEYDKLVEAQRGLCASCGRTSIECKQTRLWVDHDHATGEVRGLLCKKCNSALGLLGDSPEGVMRLFRYIASRQSRVEEVC